MTKTYTPPKVRKGEGQKQGRFTSTNRPIAGATHDKELPVGKHPLQLYSLATPNGVKITVLLEELLDHLRNDTELRVIHLKRRNLVRLLVSWKLAEHTGLWFEGDPAAVLSTRLTARDALRALRHPRWAATRVLQLWRPPARPKQASIKITANELSTFLEETQRRTADFDELFSRRSMLTVYYEDLARERQRVFGEVQTFLGLKPARLTTTLRKQNPEPLSELIENYDELYAAFKGSQYEPFFD